MENANLLQENAERNWPKARDELNPSAGLVARIPRRAPAFEDLSAEYARLWDSAQLRREKAADASASASKILLGRARYENVQQATGVPWYVVGLLHVMEAGGDFNCHLHNGDKLTRRTWQVPAGRPVKGEPPFTWLESAIDAIEYDGLDKVSSWTVERLCYALEKFNGWGSRWRGINSPYLWSGTTHYTCGKYVRDGVWDPNHVSKQSGAMAILLRLLVLCPEIHLEREGAAPQRPGVKALPKSGTVSGAILQAYSAFLLNAKLLFGLIPAVAAAAHEVRDQVSPVLDMAEIALPYFGVACLVIGTLVVLSSRFTAAQEGRIA